MQRITEQNLSYPLNSFKTPLVSFQSQLFGPFRQSSDKDIEDNSKNTQTGYDILVLPMLRNQTCKQTVIQC
jgi:hypothetical protein